MRLPPVHLFETFRLLQGSCFHYQRRLFTQTNLFNKKINICVEGNIGCGKTTALRHFKALGSLVEIQEEPIRQWRDFEGGNPLALLYGDPKRWSFMFQSFAMLTLFKRHCQPQVKPIRLMERSVYSARYFFNENLYLNGELTDMEYQILKTMFDSEMERCHVNIDLLVYLQTAPEVCLQRIKARQRPEEQIVSLDYIRDLHQLHEKFFVKGDYKNKMVNSAVLVIDNNHDKRTAEKNFNKILLDYLYQIDMVPNRVQS